MENVGAIVLAAGRGVRMQSELPKVCHELNGQPLIQHVLNSVFAAGIKNVYVVIGHKADLVREQCKDFSVTFVEQTERLGTGHAVKQVEPFLKDGSQTLIVLNGDTPLITSDTIKKVINHHKKSKSKATLLTAEFTDPAGYGRIIRNDDGIVVKIVEDKDASLSEKSVREINTGTYCFEMKHLFSSLKKLKPDNAQGEYYLTDTIKLLNDSDIGVSAVVAEDYRETLGINTVSDLEAASQIMKTRVAYVPVSN